MQPNFLCIGAQKCGTTAIWHMLNSHPSICMAIPRETNYFCRKELFEKGLEFYKSEYFGHWIDQSMIGEKCPEYLYVPHVAENIFSSLGPDVKLIVALTRQGKDRQE